MVVVMGFGTLDLSIKCCCFWFVLTLLCFVSRHVQGKVYSTGICEKVVTTQYGKIRGVRITLPNDNLPPVVAYLGLQYASVLGGDLRFMPPTSPMEKWSGIRVAMKFRPVCPQKVPDVKKMSKKLPVGRVEHFKRLEHFLEHQTEECLNLNIYMPLRGKLSVAVIFFFTRLHQRVITFLSFSRANKNA